MLRSHHTVSRVLRYTRLSLQSARPSAAEQPWSLESTERKATVSTDCRGGVTHHLASERSKPATTSQCEEHSQATASSLDPSTTEAEDTASDGRDASQATSTSRKVRGRLRKSPILPRLLRHASTEHYDLPSFLAYADQTELKTTTNVYKGTHYEYIVAEALKSFQFNLHRTGRSNDLGIDLVGHWKLPSQPQIQAGSVDKGPPNVELRVLVQCKAVKPQPSMVREMEGAYVGAPAGWQGENVLALLVASQAATKGVRDAVQRSRWPIGVLQVTSEGQIKQFLWNAVAARIGLQGLGVTVQYGSCRAAKPSDAKESDGDEQVSSRIALTWMGRLWRVS